MKSMKEISYIICNVMTDDEFDRINDAEFDSWDLDRKVARNGRRRFLRNLKKFGLTEAEWNAWDAD